MYEGGAVYTGISAISLAEHLVAEPGPKQRDWLMSDGLTESVNIGIGGILAHDKMHAAVMADFTLPPAAAPPPPPATCMSAVATYYKTLRERLDARRVQMVQIMEKVDRLQEEERDNEQATIGDQGFLPRPPRCAHMDF